MLTNINIMASLTSEKFIKPIEALESMGLAQGMIIADLGCGGGYMTLPSATIVGKGGHVFAVDIQKPVLADIESKAKLDGLDNITTVWADLEVVGSTKIQDNYCDIALLANTMYQSTQPIKMLEEAKRIIKPEGKIVVIDWTKSDIPFGPDVNKRIAKTTIFELASRLSLKTAGEFEVGKFHFGLWLTK